VADPKFSSVDESVVAAAAARRRRNVLTEGAERQSVGIRGDAERQSETERRRDARRMTKRREPVLLWEKIVKMELETMHFANLPFQISSS